MLWAQARKSSDKNSLPEALLETSLAFGDKPWNPRCQHVVIQPCCERTGWIAT